MRTRRSERPAVEALDARQLLTTGLAAQLSHNVLVVVGKSASAPIVVDVNTVMVKGRVSGSIVVEGVGTYRASDVHRVVIADVPGESVVVHRSRSWNPPVQVITLHPTTITPPPKPTPTPTPTPVTTPPTTVTPKTPPIVGTTTETAEEQEIVKAVNAQRASNGLAPLTVNPKLVQAAHIHAHDMAALDVMAHDLPGAALPGLADRAGYVNYNFTTMGENVAFNYPDVASVMTGWMNSPGHRANILDPSYTEIGVGVSVDAAGMPYYCQVFGHPA